MGMKRVPIAEFKARFSQYVEEASQEDIVITKHGRPVARLVAECEQPKREFWDYYGALPDIRVDPDDDLLSSGVQWDAL